MIASILPDAIGPDRLLMMDANQVWEVDEAIASMRQLAEFNPYWIEEPTSPDEILGGARIREAIRPILVATGEHCQNRIMFKQMLQAGAIDVCQLDVARLGGLNEAVGFSPSMSIQWPTMEGLARYSGPQHPLETKMGVDDSDLAATAQRCPL